MQIIFLIKIEVFIKKTRFDKRFNRQHAPGYQPSPLGQDLSVTLVDLANIQSRPLEILVANQRSQQKAFNELTRVNKDKTNDAMFVSIKTYDGKNRQMFED